ncbi:Hypothetical protein Achr_f1810 (plasmid) [Azotobacter chroococcum NCIMB 8003]|uniref:Uncharacterized protein n=1 Tax=Azotobacter chroococcum NCIMB 8003 TaxID=1328314 RepID=A0A0C4WV84_9GAMM|nr:Hypothetical protein Achr_f1810 [Azotobacter chroococcum NCIMB 8003]
MLSTTPIKSPFKAWLAEFLLSRGIVKESTGKPLYSYQVTEAEYHSLRALLSANIALMDNPVHAEYVGGCFALFVSEQFRRAYNASWSWSGAEGELGVSLSPTQRIYLAKRGLDYWKRPIRARENGRDWLGSLFAEGGLPWPLVQSEDHGFGRAVRSGIKHFFRTEGNRRTTADLMADFESYLPLAFQNLETRQLLAGIVDHLMFLAGQYPLKDQADPAAYLDEVAPSWADAFPIPLDETNGRNLISTWLQAAGERTRIRQEALLRAKAFTGEHILCGTLPAWTIRTELTLPTETLQPIDANTLRSMRLEVAFYEGDRMLARGPAVYGQKEGAQTRLRFPNTQITLERHCLRSPLNIRLLDSGREVHRIFIEDSALDHQEAPLIFEPVDGRWKLVSMSSCALAGGLARIRMPANFEAVTGSGIEPRLLELDAQDGWWLEAADSLSLRHGADLYRVTLNQGSTEIARPTLEGTLALYEGAPSIMYLGWPHLSLPENYLYALEDLCEFANGQLVSELRRQGAIGVMRYTVRNKAGETLLQRRFGVLPREFGLTQFPACKDEPARLQIRGANGLELAVAGEVRIAGQVASDDTVTLHLRHTGEAPPAGFTLEIRMRPEHPPLQLRLAYPYQGARLMDQDGKATLVRNLTLNDLPGLRVALTSGLPQGQDFHMRMELIGDSSQCRSWRMQRDFQIKVGYNPILLDLFSYQAKILQLLGAVDDKEAYVRLGIETETRLLTLNIQRYSGRLQREGRTLIEVVDVATGLVTHDARIEAMNLADPKQKPIALGELTSEGVGTGRFDTADYLPESGAWLIYPASDSSKSFPVWVQSTYASSLREQDGAPKSVDSLHKAAEVFHPQLNPGVIDEQIARMQDDFGHSGWQYLADLKQLYGHLPLSSFEPWKALTHNPEALSFAVFRLEMNEAFCTRMADELAVIWEAIPLPVWVKAYQRYFDSLAQMGLPEAAISSLQRNRDAVLRMLVPGFDYLGDYLSTGNPRSLMLAPPAAVLPAWVNTLYSSGRRFPTDLGSELAAWIEQQSLPAAVKGLAKSHYAEAVIYLPIFMGFVTAGKATLDDLPVPLPYAKFVIRTISDFDRHDWFAPVHALMTSYLLASTA